MTKWKVISVIEEVDTEIKRLKDEMVKVLGYPEVKNRDAQKVIVAKSRKFKFSLRELREILMGKNDE